MIRNSQETEKSIEEVKDKREKTEGKIQDELNQLKNQIDSLRKASEKEEARVSELKLSCKMYDMGNLHDEQTQQQTVLTNAVTKVYNQVIGSNAAQIDTEQMLQSIEAKLNHLFESKYKLQFISMLLHLFLKLHRHLSLPVDKSRSCLSLN